MCEVKMADERTDMKNSNIIEYVIVGALGAVVLVGAHYFLTPASIPKPRTCQTIRVGESEELGDVVRRMRVYDSGVTVEKLAVQNNLLAQGKILNVLPGTELKYCYGK